MIQILGLLCPWDSRRLQLLGTCHRLPGAAFEGLLQNSSFRRQYINTIDDHNNSSLTKELITANKDQMEAVLEPEIAEHQQRWGNPGRTIEEWKQNVNKMRIWAANRHNYIWKMITDFFKLAGTATSLSTVI